MPSDLRTHAIVLRRTNYGESDRILNLLTPEGKYAVLAKGVRKEKSRLAGGIELFSLTEVVIHQGRSTLGTLTSAKMSYFYQNVLSDMSRLELASEVLRRADRAAEQVDNPEYFSLVRQSLTALDQKRDLDLIRSWFQLNLAVAMGEEINFSRDTSGAPLSAEQSYFWDHAESALRADPQGNIAAPVIKLARLLLTSDLATVSRIAQATELVRTLDPIVRAYS